MVMPLIPRSLLPGSRDLGFQALLDGFESLTGQASFPVDIEENDAAFLVRVDVPGIAPDRIALESKETRYGQLLTLTIQPAPARTDGDATFHRQERVAVTGRRMFVLPRGVDADRIQAAQEHGVLTITLPRRRPIQSESRPIVIQSGESTSDPAPAASA